MEILRKLKSMQFRLSRGLLFSWIKPTYLGTSTGQLGLNESDRVCYVMPYRSIADLLVTDKACEQADLPSPVGPLADTDETRSVFFLGRPEGTLGRKSLRHQSERMTRLFEHQETMQETMSDASITIVPVSLFWGHQPDREKSIFKLLLSEHWSATSQVKKFFAMLFHPRHILVQFGKPIRLGELMATENQRERQVRKLMRLLRVHFNNERQAIIGPDLSHRRTLINTIINAPEVRAAIEREAGLNGRGTIEKIEKKAHAYVQEIASDQSYRVIRFFDVLLSWLWNNLYDGIEVNHIQRLKDLAQSHEIVYTPCHRSHIDYLLLSYVLYHNGLTPPHIAAGRNLNLPLIGSLLRRAGAFYMRRSFQGDQLYKAVFDEYLHQMFTKGYSVEYFIEGGRSRTGRTLPPRTGMLSMTVRSFQKDATKPIAFLPVYFGYERVLESSTYSAELSGSEKRNESVFDVFGIFSAFNHDLGRVTVNFGEPVILADFLDDALPNWQSPAEVAPNALSNACLKLARQLATRINAAVAVNATNLVSVALLSTSRESIEENHLVDQIKLLRDIALVDPEREGSMTLEPAESLIDEAINILGLSRDSHPFGNIISASREQAVAMTYNVNNVAHVYTLPSLVCRYLRFTESVSMADLDKFVNLLYPYLQAEFMLAADSQSLPSTISEITSRLSKIGIVQQEGSTLNAPSPDSREYSCLTDIAHIGDSTLERFFIVLALIEQHIHSATRELEFAAGGIAAQLSALYGLNSPDFFEKSLFSTFLTTLKDEGVISHDLKPETGFEPLVQAISRVVDPDVRYNILQAVRASSQPVLPE